MSVICGNCFNQEETGAHVCSRCGQRLTANPQGMLPVGSILDGRYRVGRVLGRGDVGVTYLAQVYQTKETVAIAEYLPMSSSRRRSNGVSVAAQAGQEDAFDRGKASFLGGSPSLQALGGVPGIQGMQRSFQENGTAYRVLDYQAQGAARPAVAAARAVPARPAVAPVRAPERPVPPMSPVPAWSDEAADSETVLVGMDGSARAGAPVAPRPQPVGPTPVVSQPVVAPAVGGQAPVQAGRVRDDWVTWKVVVLSFVTLGIYGLYFYYHVARELNTICEGDGKHTRNIVIAYLALYGSLAASIAIAFAALAASSGSSDAAVAALASLIGVIGILGIADLILSIYVWVWLYGVGERIRDNARRYGANVTTGGGALIACQLGSVAAGLLTPALAFVAILAWIASIVLTVLGWNYLVKAFVALASAYNARQ